MISSLPTIRKSLSAIVLAAFAMAGTGFCPAQAAPSPASPATAKPAARRTVAPSNSATGAAAGDVPAAPVATAEKRNRTRVPKASQPTFNSNLVLLDPGHGGTDKGGDLGANNAEKNVNLAFAKRLRGLLAGRGFTVTMTRENDPAVQSPAPAAATDSSDEAPAPPPTPVLLSADARAEVANRAHAVACLVLHTTAAGHGLHLYTSALAAPPPVQAGPDRPIALWDTAQAAYLAQSTAMATDLSQAFDGLRVPVISGRASVGPMDFMSCPVVALEIAPLAISRENITPATDEGYQQRVAEAVVSGLIRWREHAQAQAQAMDAAAHVNTPEKALKPSPRPKAKPILNPDGSPAALPLPSGGMPTPARRPAPVLRPDPVRQAPPTGGER